MTSTKGWRIYLPTTAHRKHFDETDDSKERGTHKSESYSIALAVAVLERTKAEQQKDDAIRF